MAQRDRRLSANFWLHEFTGWQDATDAQVRRLEETASRVLQPIRNKFGKVTPTSWVSWRSGAPRTGSHAFGGTVDFVVDGGRTREAFEWGARYLVPAGYIGRWIYEPDRSAAEGQPQGEHVHMAPVVDMVDHVGDDRIQVLEELNEGNFVFYRVAAAATGGALLVAGALVLFFLAPTGPRVAT